ncbi:MAG TPA: class II fructose-bisphosphate aldolase [Candidatus Egerieimonas intestinavium]|uniref:Class II fructose-bisphosphate aldolase n=1 Tax=Candidatus Egerieimonas intestinavium TaxID=2840777 RepID=A0A9D1JFU1_9FIRM|nr:class II fructose-bisphosphate aldolase [Candidatus Egerieimonas intestinavium]
MLITLKEMMDIAEERQIAVGSFNTPNLESLQAVLSAADELQLPVIIQHAQCHEDWIPLELIGPLMVELARKAKIPVCVHLDHGETLEYLQRALELGFTSVMYDGSVLGYQENVENTKKAVALAARWGASVEAELGSMGKRESGAGDGTGEADETKIYTDPRQAAEFVRETGIDALACSFGTTHGIYLTAPKLNFSIVEEVRREAGGIPVVMHGGSGVSPREFHRAVQAGVRKINYFTYMDKAGGTAAAQCAAACREGEPLFYSQIIRAAREGMKKNVKEAMGTFALLDQ